MERTFTEAVFAGVIVGTAAAVGAAVLLMKWLPGTEIDNPLVMATAGVLLMAVATATSALPGWRVLRSDPLAALRSD